MRERTEAVCVCDSQLTVQKHKPEERMVVSEKMERVGYWRDLALCLSYFYFKMLLNFF